jgi:transposase
MANIGNIQDFTIRWNGHQKYKSGKIIENEIVEVIVQKLEMILFTNKDEIFGQDSIGFGANLEKYLWGTKVSGDLIKNIIVKQITCWAQELVIIGYELNIDIFEGTYRDIMQINFIINGYNIGFIFQ